MLWLVLGLAAALILCCWASVIGAVVAWGDDLYAQISDRTRNSVGLNEAGRDGQLEFRVTGIECGVPRVGDQFVNQTAVGQFCEAHVTVRNRGDRPITFDDSLQRAYGPADRQFVPDQTAGMIANAAQPMFLAPINPGNQVEVILVYDIPTDARLLKLRLRATTDSHGVLVEL